MSRIVFTVPSYKAINSAAIANDGITVIAGENGSGKSTLSRMMYYMINIISDFAGYILKETIKNVVEVARPLHAAMMQTTRQLAYRSAVRERFDQLSKARSFEELSESMLSMIEEYKPMLLSFFETEKDEKKQERILGYLGIGTLGTPEERADACVNKVYDDFLRLDGKARGDIDTHPKSLLIEFVRAYGLDLDDFPSKGVKLSEDGVELIMSKYFSAPLSLHRAIYIDTPMAVNDNWNFSTRYWNNLMSLLNHDDVKGTPEEELLQRKLRNILSGDILIEKDKISSMSKLCYRRDDGLEIELVKAATGFKSFAYLLRLLMNGFLKQDTLLLIDEPEAHLHPQWIVEFANILVQLNKILGVKVMVTSHNPDMVSAIRSISEAEGVLDSTRFYLANSSENNPYKYDYIDLGTDIGPIFESFNIALNKIDYYGTGSAGI